MDKASESSAREDGVQPAIWRTGGLFAPDELRILGRGLSTSTIMHGLLAASLLAYGVEITANDLQASEARPTSKAIKAEFIFQEKEETEIKPHLVPERIAEAKVSDAKPKRARQRKPRKSKEKPKRITQARKRHVPAAASVKEDPMDAPSTIAPAVAKTTATVSNASNAETHAQVSDAKQGDDSAEAQASAPSIVDQKGLLKAYVKTLSKAVSKRRSYPRAAKLAGLEGRAVIRIVLNDRGKIVAIELARSSGHDILDRAALEAARGVGRLPPAPKDLKWGTRAIKVPFSFKIAS